MGNGANNEGMGQLMRNGATNGAINGQWGN